MKVAIIVIGLIRGTKEYLKTFASNIRHTSFKSDIFVSTYDYQSPLVKYITNDFTKVIFHNIRI